MEKQFKDLLETEGVLGLTLLSPEGKVLHKADPSNILLAGSVDEIALELVHSLTDSTREADMVFSERRVYLRRTPIGSLLIFLTLTAPVAMVRLHCDTLIPTLKSPKPTRGLWRFFGKWR